jgi:hypothetical integral membrane protein (TIGR02206 family)
VKRSYKVFIMAGFAALYGMQLVMALILCTSNGIRLHAPTAGISLPINTTVIGDAWMRAGIASVEVRVRDEASGAGWSVPAQRDAVMYGGKAVFALAAWRTKLSFPSAGTYSLSAVVTAIDGRTLETQPRTVSASPVAVSREFVFGSVAHLIPILLVVALSIAVPLLARRSGSPVVRDRVALAITCALWVHEIAYEVYWFIIGAWTVGNCLLLHMCALAIMFLPVFYFSADGRFRQYLFELLYFFGLGGAVQALFAPDIGMHGFPDMKYFDYFFSHGTIVIGVVYAAALFGVKLGWKSLVRIAVGTTALTLAAFGLDRLLALLPPYEMGNYFIMGYPPPTGSVIDIFASIFGPSPRYLVGLELMGAVLLAVMYLPYPILRRISRKRVS